MKQLEDEFKEIKIKGLQPKVIYTLYLDWECLKEDQNFSGYRGGITWDIGRDNLIELD